MNVGRRGARESGFAVWSLRNSGQGKGLRRDFQRTRGAGKT